jgi:hypothetical protein
VIGGGGTIGAGGLIASGGRPAAGGVVGSGGGPIDCSRIGCGPPTVCGEPCGAPCGCCPCADGLTSGGALCKGGCYVPLTDAGAGCIQNGITYPVGSSYPAGDGCNTCSCTGAGPGACTKMACACDPVAEAHRRNYVGLGTQCSFIRYACKAPTTSFSNACGCGCEQDPSCPDWINCMPSPGAPPCADLQAKCPYSGVAF